MIENPWILLGAFPLAAYGIGSTPFGVILSRARGVDIRKAGSGNVGATNVGRVLGRRWGWLCFALDVLKGFAPALAVSFLAGCDAGGPTTLQQAAWLAVGAGAILGHVLSFWLGFRGGKGVATALGVVLGLYPYFTFAGLAALGVWIAVTLASRYVSLGSIVAAGAFLAFFVGFNWAFWGLSPARLWPLVVFCAVIVALILFRHRTNISRLLAGTENKIGAAKKQTKTPA